MFKPPGHNERSFEEYSKGDWIYHFSGERDRFRAYWLEEKKSADKGWAAWKEERRRTKTLRQKVAACEKALRYIARERKGVPTTPGHADALLADALSALED